MSATAVQEMHRLGCLALADGKWADANSYFSKATQTDRNFAPAYIGSLCAKLKVNSAHEISDFKDSPAATDEFKAARRFAN